MNLTKLFETQRILDERIEKEHPRFEDEDRLAKKILALQVEVAELANELPEVFKFWSNKKNNYENALKEYVDGLHLILSIGLEMDYNLEELHIENNIKTHKYNDIAAQFIWLSNTVSNLFPYSGRDYDLLVYEFISLGEMLGFTWEQVETAYFEKNEINHTRQDTGY